MVVVGMRWVLLCCWRGLEEGRGREAGWRGRVDAIVVVVVVVVVVLDGEV